MILFYISAKLYWFIYWSVVVVSIMCFLLSFCSFQPNKVYSFITSLSLYDVNNVHILWVGLLSALTVIVRDRAEQWVSPALHYCGLFPENDDVKERKLATNETNSIGLKRAKRKQKAHNGDYCHYPSTRPQNG